jgi:hypothetical protein
MTVISGIYTYESKVYGSGCVFQYATTSTLLFDTNVLVNKHPELTSVAYEPQLSISFGESHTVLHIVIEYLL